MSGVATAIAAGATATTAAVVGAGVLGAGATLYASNQAASATRDASNAAIQAQRDAMAQQERLAAPYTGLGQQAMGAYEALLGIGKGGQLDAQKALQQLQQMPGYQFQLQQGQENTARKAAAMGMGLSGNTLAALDQYNQGLASTSYQQQLQNLLAPVQIGQAAAAGQAANIGQGAANIGNIGINQANTLAGIRSNEAAGLVGSLGGAANQWMTYNTLQGLSNPGMSSNMSNYLSRFNQPYSPGVTPGIGAPAPTLDPITLPSFEW